MHNFAEFGRSISGSTYLHLDYGPVSNRAKSIVNKLASEEIVRITTIPSESGNAKMLRLIKTDSDVSSVLENHEIEMIDRVLEEYGSMSPREITRHSHEETAYKSTKDKHRISYKYAKFLKQLPKK